MVGIPIICHHIRVGQYIDIAYSCQQQFVSATTYRVYFDSLPLLRIVFCIRALL